MKSGALLVLLLCASAAAAPRKRPAAKRRAPVQSVSPSPSSQGSGQVTFLTASAAYLDRGSADGLTSGAGMTVTRSGRSVGRCTISALAERFATCTGQGLKVGDRISVARAEPPLPPSAPPPLPDEAELEERNKILSSQPLPQVDFVSSAGLLNSGTRLASVALSQTSWVNAASTQGPYQVQRIDVGVYDVHLWRGLHASVDLSVLNFSRRPPNFRSPLTGTPVLQVRQLELSWRPTTIPIVAQLGRTWTRFTPGLLIVDGAQAGWRSADDTVQLGAYGGLLPDPVSLGLSLNRWTVGAYAMARFESGKGALGSLLQVEAHLGYAVRALVPGRLELGAALHAWLSRTFDVHLQLLLAAAPGFVDGVRLDLGWRPAPTVRIFAGGRYQGTVAAEPIPLGVTLPGQRALHADAGAVVELLPWLWLGATAGLAHDLTSVLTQARFGPELTLPRLFGGAASLTVGYQEELGWLRGRTAWLQLTVVPISRLRILTRGSWFHQQLDAGSAGLAGQEVGASLVADVAITSWLWLRGTAMGRLQPTPTDADLQAPLGGSGMIQIGGQL